MAKAMKLFTGFTGDFTADKQWAVRADGAVFMRTKTKHPRYGWRWGWWIAASSGVPEGTHEATATDACINHRAYFGKDGAPNVRLPG